MEEGLAKAQSFFNEYAQTIGMVLLAVVLLAGVAWFMMSRSNTKSDVLENAARVNQASTSETPPNQEQLEELVRQREETESNSVEAASPGQNE